MNSHLVTIIICCEMSLAAQTQQTKDPQKLKVVPRIVAITRAEPVRGQNDKVFIDKDGDIVAEGATLSNGQPFTFRITRRIHVQPEVHASIRESGGIYQYEYQISNGRGGKQWIQLFWLDVLGPKPIAQTPAYWHVYNIEPRTTPLHRIYIGRLAADNDGRARLMPGGAAGPFVLNSAWRPGLVELFAMGHKSTPAQGAASDEAYETFSGKMSDWLREEISRSLRDENNSVKVFTIGPKISPEVAPADAVRAELLQGARVAAFPQEDRKAMLEAASMGTAVEMRTAIQRLASNTSGLTAQFCSAMLSYLR